MQDALECGSTGYSPIFQTMCPSCETNRRFSSTPGTLKLWSWVCEHEPARTERALYICPFTKLFALGIERGKARRSVYCPRRLCQIPVAFVILLHRFLLNASPQRPCTFLFAVPARPALCTALYVFWLACLLFWSIFRFAHRHPRVRFSGLRFAKRWRAF